MSHPSVIQILKLNEPRSGKTDKGKEWKMQEAECILLDSDGGVTEVGVLDIPRELIGLLKPGNYRPSYAFKAHYQTRKIGPVLVALEPIGKAAPSASKV